MASPARQPGEYPAEPFEKKLTTTALTAVLTNDAKQPLLIADLGICNYHASAVVIGVELYRFVGTTSFKRYSGYSLAAGATLSPQLLAVLLQNDELRVSASVANVVDVTGTVQRVI